MVGDQFVIAFVISAENVCLQMSAVICCQAKHATEDNTTWGVDGDAGTLVDMKEFGIWEPYSVKAQAYKTAIEVCSYNAGRAVQPHNAAELNLFQNTYFY